MKCTTLFLLLGIVAGMNACSQKDNPAPDGNPEELAGLVKEKHVYASPITTNIGSLYRFSYDASNKLSRLTYDIKQANGGLQPMTYDSLVYNGTQLVRRYAFKYDETDRKFYPENRQELKYKNNLLDSIILWAYEPANQTYFVSVRTSYTYVDGRETEVKETDGQHKLLNRYVNIYQGNRLSTQEWYDENNASMLHYTYHYIQDTLRAVYQDGNYKNSTRYEYRNGKLHKEIFEAEPPLVKYVDSIVYRY